MSGSEIQAFANAILRYAGGGGSFVLALGLAGDWKLRYLRLGDPPGDISLYFTTLVIAVVGVMIYALHRALPYPFILMALHWLRQRRNSAAPTEATLAPARVARRKADDAMQRHLDTWGSEAHFLYCCAWGHLAAIIVCHVAKVPCSHEELIVVAIVVLFLGAVRHDWRMTQEESAHLT